MALIALKERLPYCEITIKRICQEARVVRSTYYRNFEFKDEILMLCLDEMSRRYHLNHYRADDVSSQLLNFFNPHAAKQGLPGTRSCDIHVWQRRPIKAGVN